MSEGLVNWDKDFYLFYFILFANKYLGNDLIVDRLLLFCIYTPSINYC